MDDKTILVTGSPGFIGAHLVLRLLGELSGATIISLDSMNDYYDRGLKEYRLKEIEKAAAVSRAEHVFVRGDITDQQMLDRLFSSYRPHIVVNLAAQAGVRYSVENPGVYVESNILGFFQVLEACRLYGTGHLIYGSSASVYGHNNKVPFETADKTDAPLSVYAATKKSDELLAYAYAGLYGLRCTGLRFFSVYGPAGRPDMFYYLAAERLCNMEKIKLFNYGNMKRDFTYIDDVVECIVRVMRGAYVKEKNPGTFNNALYNIGKGHPEDLARLIEILKDELVKAELLSGDYDLEEHLDLAPLQAGDMEETYADNRGFYEDYGFRPGTSLRD
ncbi:MAG: NAD-dependent epimerase/dehydratase family protein, partial [Lachnospiraceae bacterium]|nr:NAD-dependent epimerase/dehydratase family protein [Lachnospiraceae bacterium]